MKSGNTPALQDGFFVVENGATYLVGSKCSECGRIHYPQHEYCAQCCSPRLEPIRLSRRGKIGSFSYIDRQPAEAFVKAPYMQAEIELPEGVSIFSVIDAKSQNELAIGMTAEVDVEDYDTPGGKRQAFIFRPVRN